ncbi:MAG: pyruvate ferredoxin oxidoreductase [Jatrophihabitantaceae bacterium]
MRELMEGSQAIAEVVRRCRPQVVPAYPITPQTHIVERLGRLIKAGALPASRFLTVESEFAAMSVAIGASATGSRTYTATASQGLLYMAEALFNAAGLGLPVVMTVANRAIGAPINIWNDHSDSMSQRDCGWIQLYAKDNQQAVDLHVLAFRLAEQLSVPVMVCVDGFVLTHAFEPLELPEQELIDGWLPDYQPRQRLDIDDPVTIGAMVGPDAFTEVRYLADVQQVSAIGVLAELATDYARQTGRGLAAVSGYHTEQASTVVVALGSVTGTLRPVIEKARASGQQVGLLELTLFRPFPYAEVRRTLAGADRVIVLERAFAPGAGGIVAADVRTALAGLPIGIDTVIAGLGGRSIGEESLLAMLTAQQAGESVSFLDLRTEVVERELDRMAHAPGSVTQRLVRESAPPGSRLH